MVWSIYKRVRTIHRIQRMILEVKGFHKGKQLKVKLFPKLPFIPSPPNECKNCHPNLTPSKAKVHLAFIIGRSDTMKSPVP